MAATPILPLAMAFAALTPAGAYAGAEPPPALIEATEVATALCRNLGGTPVILDGYRTVKDLNGDGRPDFLTDLADLQCGEAWGAFCGPSGCPVSAWLSEPGGGYVRFDFGHIRGFSIRDEAEGVPAVVARYDTTGCGEGHDGGCTRTWRFTSDAPAEPPVDAPVETAAAAAPPTLAPGWTLRKVPGASPVALGAGIGNLSSLAAFCLAGQPFLAVTFRDRPKADEVKLGFAFGEGPLDAEAGFEQTAGGAYVIALAGTPLADRLGGRDTEVEVSVDGTGQGMLSLEGSTKALRGALADCR
ncbi:MAG: hypothetical protein U1E59_02890 [Amaricoccus sp.]